MIMPCHSPARIAQRFRRRRPTESTWASPSVGAFWAACVALACSLLALAPVAWGEWIDPDLWGTDGTVAAIARSGNTIYVGGFFTTVGPNTGGGSVLDRRTGDPVSGFPRVTGVVDAATEDGAGGWFIGGSFVAVGGLPRSNLAHVFADGSVAEWAPNTDGEVLALARSGGCLYIGGFFTHLGGVPRSFIGAADAVTGSVTSWNPGADLQVRALLVHQGGLYVGGDFTTIGGQARLCAAELDLTSGQVTTWDPSVGFSGLPGSVRALAALGDTIYIGGDFGNVGAAPRARIAAVSVETGVPTAWNPVIVGPGDMYYGDPYVSAMAVKGNSIFVGGHFTGVSGQTRGCLAKLDLATGQALSWDPVSGPLIGAEAPDVHSLALGDTSIFVSGDFTTIGGQERRYCAEIGLESALASPFQPRPNEPIHALVVEGNRVFAGGPFTSIGSLWARRSGLAAFDATTGEVKAWDPAPDGIGIYSLALYDGALYVGGDFTSIGGQPRSSLAALDTLTAAATPWNPSANWTVTTLTVVRDTLFAGGVFTSLGGQTRNRLGSFDLASGQLTSWDPNANSDVYGLAISGKTVYVAGFFSTIAGVSRRFGVAAVDASSGVATTWNPQSDNWVNAVAVVDSVVFVGGRFNTIGGQPRTNLAALDPVTGAATSWTANTNSTVLTLATVEDTLYVGGGFSQVGGQPRNGLAALDIATGSVLPWNPDLSVAEWQGSGSVPSVLSIVPFGQTLLVGGGFDRISESLASNVAAISFGNPPPPLTPPPSSVLFAGLMPNPVRGAATVRFSLPRAGPVTLTVFDLQGRRVESLLDHALRPAGANNVALGVEGWREGFYFCRLQAGGTSVTRKFVVLR